MSDRTTDAGRRARALLAPLAVAAVLAGAAVVTVERSGCDDPARYVSTGGGVTLVGGCISPHDLPLWPTPDDKESRRG